MTRATKAVWRIVSTPRGDRCVAIAPEGIYIRHPRSRSTHLVSFGAVEDLGAKQTAAMNGVAVPRPRRRAGAR